MKLTNNKLTAVVPVYNEEQYLDNCLKSLSFVDEILILDSGSTDNSIQIAKQHNCRIINYTWQGFTYAHNYGAKLATHNWLLYLDADERVSKKLKQSILSELANPIHQAYQLNRKNFIMGKALKFGGWYPDPATRLIHKHSLKKWVGELHEYPQIIGSTGNLEGDIYHLTHRGLEWMLHKTISYTRTNAKLLFSANHPKVTVKNFFGSMAREFYFRCIQKQGYRDGLIGWLEIIYQTFNAFLIQVWVWEMQQQQSWSQKYRAIDRKIRQEIDQ